MSDNCLKVQLKGTVENADLPIFGMAYAYIDTTGASSNVQLKFKGDPSGAKIVGEGTFTDNTTEITSSSDTKYVAPDSQIKIAYPKYVCIPDFNERITTSTNARRSPMSVNLDDLKYANIGSSNKINSFKIERNSTPFSGDITSILPVIKATSYLVSSHEFDNSHITGDVTKLNTINWAQIFLVSSSITGSIEHVLDASTSCTLVSCRGSNGITGDRSVAFRNMVQANTSHFKGRTNSMTFYKSAGMSDSWANSVNEVTYQFSGTSTVTVKDGNTTLGTYDIDTDTYTPAS